MDEEGRRQVAARLVDVGDVAAAEADGRARQQRRRGAAWACAVAVFVVGVMAPEYTYQLSVCKEGVGSHRAHAGRTHRGHPGPAHRDGPPPLRREGLRRHLDRGDPGRGRRQPRRALPPLRAQDRPVPGDVRGRRGRAHRADARRRHRQRRDRPDADPRARLRRVLGPVRQPRGPADRDARRPHRPRVGHLARARRALRLRHDQDRPDHGGADGAGSRRLRSSRCRTSCSARSSGRAWWWRGPTTRPPRSGPWRSRSRGSSRRSESRRATTRAPGDRAYPASSSPTHAGSRAGRPRPSTHPCTVTAVARASPPTESR